MFETKLLNLPEEDKPRAVWKFLGLFPVSDSIEDSVYCRRRTIDIWGWRTRWFFPIAASLHSSSAVVFGVHVFGGDAGWFIRKAHRVFRRISDAKYWCYYRLHPSHRYHMVDTGLGYGYHERDEQLLGAMMAVFLGYVDDCEASGVHDPGDAAREILHWWRIKRPADQARIDALFTELYLRPEAKARFEPVQVGEAKLFGVKFDSRPDDLVEKRQELWDLEECLEQDVEENLHKIVAMRRSLWT